MLTEEQAHYIYKEIDPVNGLSLKIKEKSVPNLNKIKEKSIPEEENVYKEGIIARPNKKTPERMKEWSILSDHVKYVQHDESDTLYKLNFDMLNHKQNESLYKELSKEEMLKSSVDFSGISEKLKSDYLDVYDGVYTEVVSTNRV